MRSENLFRHSGLAAIILCSLILTCGGCGLEQRILGSQSQERPAAEVVGVSGRTDEAPVVQAGRLNVSGPEVPEAQLAAIANVQEAALKELQGQSHEVVGTAVSMYNGKPVLVALTRSHSRGIPRVSRGADVVELVVGDVRAQSYCCGTSTSRADECASGTLGAIVTDGIRSYWLSNWHVFVHPQGKVGDNVCSPGRYYASCGATPVIGTVSRFTPIRFDGSANTVDCAIARIIPGTNVSRLEAAGSNSFVPSGHVVAPSVNMAVKKVGGTTGFTTGTIVAVNATLSVSYRGIGTAKFTGVILTSAMSQEGDSGSLICQRSTNYPVALLFAGSSSVSVGGPIGTVFTAIGAHIPS